MGKFKRAWSEDATRVVDDLLPKNLDIAVGSAGLPFKDAHLQSLAIRSGASHKGGTFTANGTSEVLVLNSHIGLNSLVLFSPKTVGGTPSAAPYVSAKTADTSFSVKAGAGDSSVYNYVIIDLDPYT